MKKKQTTSQAKGKFSLVPFNTESGDVTAAPALDYLGIGFDNQYRCYLPPINRYALARLPYQNAQHGGILHSRANMISGGYQGGKLLSLMDMRALCLNLVQFGDVALLKVRNGFGQVVRLHVLSSLYLRVLKEGGYAYLMKKSLYDTANEVYHYRSEDIIFIKLYDPAQQVYGSPDYVGGIQSGLLNSDATLFRRRYFNNGAHMGYILYTTDPDLSEEMEEEIRRKIQQSKGVGNFRSMFINIPDGKPDGVKLIPVGDTGTKDEFANIKNISAQDIFTAHRYPPGLGGIIPSNTGGFGDPLKIRLAYRQDEVFPMQDLIADTINNDPDLRGKLSLKIIFEQPERNQETL